MKQFKISNPSLTFMLSCFLFAISLMIFATGYVINVGGENAQIFPSLAQSTVTYIVAAGYVASAVTLWMAMYTSSSSRGNILIGICAILFTTTALFQFFVLPLSVTNTYLFAGGCGLLIATRLLEGWRIKDPLT